MFCCSLLFLILSSKYLFPWMRAGEIYLFFFNAEIGGWVPGFYTETGKEDGLRSLIHLLVISLCEFVLNVSSGLFQITCLHSKQKRHLLEGK